MRVAMSDLTGVVNVGSGAPVTVRRLSSTIESLLGREELVRHGARPDNPTDFPDVYMDHPKLVQDSGWALGYGLASNLRQTIDWSKSGVPSR